MKGMITKSMKPSKDLGNQKHGPKKVGSCVELIWSNSEAKDLAAPWASLKPHMKEVTWKKGQAANIEIHGMLNAQYSDSF